jgi:hypothetical protein
LSVETVQRVFSTTALLAVLSLVFAGGATARTLRAWDGPSFQTALAQARSGDTIALRDGSYPILVVQGRRFGARLRIEGSRNASLAGTHFDRSSNITLVGVTVTPPGTEAARISIRRSRHITVDRVLVAGRRGGAGASIATDRTSADVIVRRSEITTCGSGARCIELGARRLLIAGNAFHDCYDCDFIRGSGAGGVTIRGNSFDRAIRGGCTQGTACNHNDHIQVMGGGPWRIVGNRFGDRNGGAASIWVNHGLHNTGNRIHDVFIASNVFSGDAGVFAVRIGGGTGGGVGLPGRIAVVNNTILSGTVSAVAISSGWHGAAPSARPLVANNIFATSGRRNCALGRFSSNLAERGAACAGGEVGPARLDSAGRPTRASALVIDRAHPRYAPARDFAGSVRRGRPDRGAFEYRGGGAPRR